MAGRHSNNRGGGIESRSSRAGSGLIAFLPHTSRELEEEVLPTLKPSPPVKNFRQQKDPLLQGSTTIPKSATNLGPSIQKEEPYMEISHSSQHSFQGSPRRAFSLRSGTVILLVPSYWPMNE